MLCFSNGIWRVVDEASVLQTGTLSCSFIPDLRAASGFKTPDLKCRSQVNYDYNSVC